MLHGFAGRVLAAFSGAGRAPDPVVLVTYRCLKSKWRIAPTGKAALLSPGAGAWAGTQDGSRARFSPDKTEFPDRSRIPLIVL